ncbi:Mn2+ homeostasis protein Per1 [Protomyces lactucae-debilis]|uniref:Post-GPI attachment to proteins factor 3 n=1 Tax=Protomyces lactucae-debilis TaxID=2754530 RepID=A0A1Y2FI66_PROLT|nr:Mn2+ homeostasis protein Per1 [Protomyces lactucae-debilis]ORY83650.1 Mn2+ homeostasis protein Per1 [Protomyces lactucae-debilis]
MLFCFRSSKLVLFLLSLLFCPLASASRGDQLDKFQACVKENIAHRCTQDGYRLQSGQLPLALRLTGWTCASDIDYQCQRAITDYMVKNGEEVEQFHGKWPFHRVLGIQEPASVLFSILNGYVHVRGLRKVRAQVSSAFPMRRFYVIFAYVGMNAWLWSTIFHIRDFNFTEKMDYFSAGAYVLYGLFYAVIQVFQLYKRPSYHLFLVIWAAVCLVCYLAHIGYLTFVIFDYGYNMLANVVVGSLHGLIWLFYSLCKGHLSPKSPAHGRVAKQPAPIVLMLACAMALELLDFSPWFFMIDAHSLWHLATIPITAMWYNFLVSYAMLHQSEVDKSLRALL